MAQSLKKKRGKHFTPREEEISVNLVEKKKERNYRKQEVGFSYLEGQGTHMEQNRKSFRSYKRNSTRKQSFVRQILQIFVCFAKRLLFPQLQHEN